MYIQLNVCNKSWGRNPRASYEVRERGRSACGVEIQNLAQDVHL